MTDKSTCFNPGDFSNHATHNCKPHPSPYRALPTLSDSVPDDPEFHCEICEHSKAVHGIDGCVVLGCACHKMHLGYNRWNPTGTVIPGLDAVRYDGAPSLDRGEEVDRMATAYAYEEFLHRSTMHALRLRMFVIRNLPHVRFAGGRI